MHAHIHTYTLTYNHRQKVSSHLQHTSKFSEYKKKTTNKHMNQLAMFSLAIANMHEHFQQACITLKNIKRAIGVPYPAATGNICTSS